MSYAMLCDDAPVALQANPDGICAVCIFGQHCLEDNIDVTSMVSYRITARKTSLVKGRDFMTVYEKTGRPRRVDTTKRAVRLVVDYIGDRWSKQELYACETIDSAYPAATARRIAVRAAAPFEG